MKKIFLLWSIIFAMDAFASGFDKKEGDSPIGEQKYTIEQKLAIAGEMQKQQHEIINTLEEETKRNAAEINVIKGEITDVKQDVATIKQQITVGNQQVCAKIETLEQMLELILKKIDKK